MGSSLGLARASGPCLWDREFAKSARLQNSVPFSFFLFVVRLWSLTHFLTLFPFISFGFHYLWVSRRFSLILLGFWCCYFTSFSFHRHFQTRVSHQLTQGDSSCTALPGIRILHCHHHITLLFFSCSVSSFAFCTAFLSLSRPLCLAFVAVVLSFVLTSFVVVLHYTPWFVYVIT